MRRIERNQLTIAPCWRGFTLIEMLVVVAILALLLAILVPSLNQVRKLAERVPCRTNTSAMAQGFVAYAADNRQVLPPGYIALRPEAHDWRTGNPIPNQHWSEPLGDYWAWCWREFIAPYCDPSAVPAKKRANCIGDCPIDGVYDRFSVVNNGSPEYGAAIGYSRVMDCPSQKNLGHWGSADLNVQPTGEYSMTLPSWGGSWWFGHPPEYPPPPPRTPGGNSWEYRPTLISGFTAEKLIAVMEPTWRYASFPGCPGYVESLIQFMPHDGNSNAGFLDGHVEVITRDMVWDYVDDGKPYRFPFAQPLGTN